LPEQWKESIIVPIYKKGDKTDCSNYRGISLLSTTYKILSNILLSKLTPSAEEIIGDHQCGSRRNRSATDLIFCIRLFFSNGSTAPWGPRPPHFSRLHDHTLFRHIRLGRTPLDERPARRRDLYLTTHNNHNRQTSMPYAGFEPTILVREQP
jgi:hypothetical protein